MPVAGLVVGGGRSWWGGAACVAVASRVAAAERVAEYLILLICLYLVPSGGFTGS